MNMFDYFLKANLYGLLFVSCYWLLLRRHTFFVLNRAYLLGATILTLVLPLLSLPAQTVETLPVPVGVIGIPIVNVVAKSIETGPDWLFIGLLSYGFVASLLFVRALIRLWRLHQFIHNQPQQWVDDYVLVRASSTDVPTFSFFRVLVLNPADIQNELVIRHELVHIRQHHSADVVGLSLLRAIFWACPVLWLIDRMLRQVHEFLADKAVDQPGVYAQLLLDYAFNIRPNTLTNGFFNPSLLKQRILMLHRRTTTRWALSKYVVVFPLAFSLVAMTTAREDITTLLNSAADNTLTVSGQVKSTTGQPLVGAHVLIAGTRQGIPTDKQGRYTLQHVPKDALLGASFIGFTATVVPLKGRTKLNLILRPAAPDELPTMGASAVYKAIKPNPAMPIRTPPTSETIHGDVYTAVEEPAVFPTGIPGLMQYVAHALHYPAQARASGVQGNVVVQFVVLPTGLVGSATVKKGIGNGCDEEALRVVRQMPKWIPGKQNGKPVATRYVIPIQFVLEKTDDKRTGQALPKNEPNLAKKPVAFADSQRVSRADSSSRRLVRFRLSALSTSPADQRSRNRYAVSPPYNTQLNGRAQQSYSLGQQAELFLLEGTKRIDRFDDVNQNDIESIEVHKGEKEINTYRILYGEKANKGVVIIHLKRNRSL